MSFPNFSLLPTPNSIVSLRIVGTTKNSYEIIRLPPHFWLLSESSCQEYYIGIRFRSSTVVSRPLDVIHKIPRKVVIAMAVTRILLPRLNPFGGDNSTVAQYKPSPQAHFLVEQMAELEKSVLEALSALVDMMTSMETKIESYRGDLTAV
jgi:hypothetical protein